MINDIMILLIGHADVKNKMVKLTITGKDLIITFRWFESDLVQDILNKFDGIRIEKVFTNKILVSNMPERVRNEIYNEFKNEFRMKD